VVGDIDAQDTRHGRRSPLALALLVARVAADDQQLAVPPDQLAVLADPLDARSHFHRTSPTRGWSPRCEELSVLATGARPGRGRSRRKTADNPPRFAPVLEPNPPAPFPLREGGARILLSPLHFAEGQGGGVTPAAAGSASPRRRSRRRRPGR